MACRKIFIRILLFLFIFPGVVSLANGQDKAKENLIKARKAKAEGKLTDAAKYYKDAKDNLKTSKETDDEDKSEILLQYALTLPQTKIEKESDATVTEMKTAYKVVVEKGTKEQRAVALNNLGVLLLKVDKPTEALEYYKQLDPQEVPTGQKFIYLYNYGRMLEKNGQTEEAYDKYVASLSEQGQFSPAGENAGRLLLSSENPRISKMTDLVKTLTTKGDTRVARNLIYESLTKWGGDPQAVDLLSSLVQLFTEVRINLNAFEKKETEKLKAVASAHESLKPLIKDIFIAYLGRLKPDSGTTEFSSWNDGGQKSERFSQFLKMIGDEYLSTDSSQALTRYLVAWQLKHDDSDAALKAANVLLTDSPKVDPEGEILKTFIARLFDAKMGAYAEGNLEDIVSLHTVLGTIFEAQGNWGTEDSGNPSTALFQWEHAKSNEQKLREKDPSLRPSPGIYAHLANCYDKIGDQQRAQDSYLTAAELFIKQGNPIEAERILNLVEQNVVPDQQERFTQTKSNLEKLKAEPVKFE